MRRLAQVQHERQGAADRLVIDRGDERASLGAAADAQETEFLERPVRLPDRHAARFEPAGHFALGGQLVAGHEPAFRDLVLDAMDDRFRHAAGRRTDEHDGILRRRRCVPRELSQRQSA